MFYIRQGVVILQTCERCALQDGMRLLPDVIAADGVFICPRCGARVPLDPPTIQVLRHPERYARYTVGGGR